MNNKKNIRWRLAAFAGIAVALITLIPQVSLWIARGRDWQGAYAFTDYDELAYSAYLNSLIKGKPRLNNPYLGGVATSNSGENLYSIQLLPPLLVTSIVKPLGLSASTTFILMSPFVALVSSLVIFWLLVEVSRDDRLAAIGVLIVLLCGLLVSEYPFVGSQTVGSFSFLRRYIPAIPFPVFFVLCLSFWRAFLKSGRNSIGWSCLAGGSFALLVYSYFYLWTAAAAWLFCFSLIWIIARPKDLRHVLNCLGVFCLLAIPTLVLYFKKANMRATTVDETHALVMTHAPDLLRLTELMGGFILIVLALGLHRRILNLRKPATLFAASCGLAPFIVFNQQILTGRSLQPFHYEQFIVNYQILVGLVVTYHLMQSKLRIRPKLWVLFAIVVGLTTGVKSAYSTVSLNSLIDSAVPVFETVSQNDPPGIPVVLVDNHVVAAATPSDFDIALLWSPHMYTFGSTTLSEEQERFYQFLYYTGIDEQTFESMLLPVSNGSQNSFWTIFGLHRLNLKLTNDFQPISMTEIKLEIDNYRAYTSSFASTQADRWPLSHVILVQGKSYNLSNLDRWYVREPSQPIGNWILVRVHRRPHG